MPQPYIKKNDAGEELMDFQSDVLDFSQPLHGGPCAASKIIVFPHVIMGATVGIAGHLVECSGEDNHHLGMLKVALNIGISGNTASVTSDFGLRDWSGAWDDEYDGQIGFVVLVELKSATVTPARSDLVITGAEFNRSTQFLCASRYLDPADMLPGNSVFLIEGRHVGRLRLSPASGA